MGKKVGRPPIKIKETLKHDEILDIVSMLDEALTLLSGVDVSILLENEALDEAHAEAVVYARVRIIQCQKLLGARRVPKKHNNRPLRKALL